MKRSNSIIDIHKEWSDPISDIMGMYVGSKEAFGLSM
jgi:hypothetical protein